jgi:hypothetical protein
MRALLPILASSFLIGCTAQRVGINQSAVDRGSRSAIAAINAGINSVETSSLEPADKQAAQKLLGQLSLAILITDSIALRGAGSRMSPAQAEEADATLALIYRQIEAVASRPPQALARSGQTLTPDTEAMLKEFQEKFTPLRR